MNYRVGIVGAGLSGLAAAHHLQQAGLEPVLFEANSFPGGRMSSEAVNGFLIDTAAYTLPDFYQNLTAFITKLGLAPLLTETSSTSCTHTNSNKYSVKIGDSQDFLRYKIVSAREKAKLIKLFLYTQSKRAALNLGYPSQETFKLEKESAADFILKKYGQPILEKIIYPLFAEIFLGNPESNSTLALLLALQNLTRFKIYNLRSGMGSLAEHLAQSLQVRLKAPIQAIRNVTSSGPFEVLVGGDRPGREVFDAVILALPLPAAAEICEGLPESVRTDCFSVQYAPAIVMACGLDCEYGEGAMINNFLRKDFRFIATVVFDRHKGPGRVPEGKDLATVILREQASRALFGQHDETVIHSALKELDTVFPRFSQHTMFVRVYRWDYGAVQLPPGAVAEKVRLCQALQTCLPRIAVASDSLSGTSLESSYLSGCMAASRVVSWAQASA